MPALQTERTTHPKLGPPFDGEQNHEQDQKQHACPDEQAGEDGRQPGKLLARRGEEDGFAELDGDDIDHVWFEGMDSERVNLGLAKRTREVQAGAGTGEELLQETHDGLTATSPRPNVGQPPLPDVLNTDGVRHQVPLRNLLVDLLNTSQREDDFRGVSCPYGLTGSDSEIVREQSANGIGDGLITKSELQRVSRPHIKVLRYGGADVDLVTTQIGKTLGLPVNVADGAVHLVEVRWHSIDVSAVNGETRAH